MWGEFFCKLAVCIRLYVNTKALEVVTKTSNHFELSPYGKVGKFKIFQNFERPSFSTGARYRKCRQNTCCRACDKDFKTFWIIAKHSKKQLLNRYSSTHRRGEIVFPQDGHDTITRKNKSFRTCHNNFKTLCIRTKVMYGACHKDFKTRKFRYYLLQFLHWQYTFIVVCVHS